MDNIRLHKTPQEFRSNYAEYDSAMQHIKMSSLSAKDYETCMTKLVSLTYEAWAKDFWLDLMENRTDAQKRNFVNWSLSGSYLKSELENDGKFIVTLIIIASFLGLSVRQDLMTGLKRTHSGEDCRSFYVIFEWYQYDVVHNRKHIVHIDSDSWDELVMRVIEDKQSYDALKRIAVTIKDEGMLE